jgi:hypothetical protein
MMLTHSSAFGKIEIIMCAGIDERNVGLDLDTGSSSKELVLVDQSLGDDDDHASANQLCSFAVVSALVLRHN